MTIRNIIRKKVRTFLNKYSPKWLRKIIIDYNIRTIKPFLNLDEMHRADGCKPSYDRLHGSLFDMWAFPVYVGCEEKFEPVEGSVLKETRLKPEYQKIKDEYWKKYEDKKKEHRRLYSDIENYIKEVFPSIKSTEIVWNYDKNVIKRNGHVSINVNKYYNRIKNDQTRNIYPMD